MSPHGDQQHGVSIRMACMNSGVPQHAALPHYVDTLNSHCCAWLKACVSPLFLSPPAAPRWPMPGPKLAIPRPPPTHPACAAPPHLPIQQPPHRRTSLAAARSTLSMPTPARPTTFSRPLAASITSRVTCPGRRGRCGQGQEGKGTQRSIDPCWLQPLEAGLAPPAQLASLPAFRHVDRNI